MLTLFITANLLALTYGGDTFWDATNGECALFTSTAPAIFIRDSERCGVCPASTCHGNTGDINFSPRCFSLREPTLEYEADQAFYAKCFDRTNNPACDIYTNEIYFEWDVFPKNCNIDNLGSVDNNGCPSCVDSNTLCDSTTKPIFVVDAPPSGSGGMCYISGCTANYTREFKVFNGLNIQFIDAMTLHYIRDRCPALSNCNDPTQWIMDFCECPYCDVPGTSPTTLCTPYCDEHTTSNTDSHSTYAGSTTDVGVFDQGSANKYGYGIGLVISFLLYII
eukprot:261263_1